MAVEAGGREGLAAPAPGGGGGRGRRVIVGEVRWRLLGVFVVHMTITMTVAVAVAMTVAKAIAGVVGVTNMGTAPVAPIRIVSRRHPLGVMVVSPVNPTHIEVVGQESLLLVAVDDVGGGGSLHEDRPPLLCSLEDRLRVRVMTVEMLLMMEREIVSIQRETGKEAGIVVGRVGRSPLVGVVIKAGSVVVIHRIVVSYRRIVVSWGLTRPICIRWPVWCAFLCDVLLAPFTAFGPAASSAYRNDRTVNGSIYLSS